MADPIEKKVEELLLSGKGRSHIYKTLKDTLDPHKLLFFVNNNALPKDRNTYRFINLFLAVILFFITTKKLLAIFSFDIMGLTLILSLIVPIINIYVLREVLRFHRLGYQFLFILSILSLIQPENHYLFEFSLHVVMIAISGFLYLKIFPSSELIVPPSLTEKAK